MKITKGDKIIISAVLIINLLSIPFIFAIQKEGTDFIVEVDNDFFGKYSLEKEQLISVKGKLGRTEIEIKNRQVRILRSPCLHKLCIKIGWIAHTGKMTACIPNKVVVRVLGNNHDGLDAITG